MRPNLISSIVIHTLFIFFMTMQHSGTSGAQYVPILSLCNQEAGNYTNTTAYKTNLHHVLSDLVSKAPDNIFYNTSHGADNDQVFGNYYCRFDINPLNCHHCIQDAARRILQNCSVEKTAIIWYDVCTLRFASHSMYSKFENESAHLCYNSMNVTSSVKFLGAIKDGMSELIEKAAHNKSNKGIAYGVKKVSEVQEVHCFVQCRPDTTGEDCYCCLTNSLRQLEKYCKGEYPSGIDMAVNCHMRYDVIPFLDLQIEPPLYYGSPPRGLPTPPTTAPSGKNATNHYIIRVAIPTVAALGFLLIGLCYYFLRRRQIQISKQPSKRTTKDAAVELGTEPNQVQTHDLQSFEIRKIEIATNNFSISNILGEGGFGVVYRGTLENGKQVAIKRLSKGLSQGIREFKTEVEVVAKLQQRNLVQLLGFCIEGEERMLVYEFLVNLSLDKFLFDRSRSSLLTWPIRNNIIYGTARGLHYLHEDSRLTIIHRDLKTSNILLDEQFDPKIGDFGIARLVNWDETAGFTSKLVGTMGYMAPEYTNSGQFSVKSDVYSLGIIILEILSGLKVVKYNHPIHGEGLLGTAWRVWSEGSIGELVDPILGNNYSTIEAKRCLHIGLLCVQDDPARRPTMHAVLHMLNSNSGEFPYPLIPSHGVTTYEINTSASVTMSDDKGHHTGQSISGDTGSLDTLSMYYH